MSPKAPSTHAGFTMLELIVAVALVAILTTLAAPGLRDFIMNSRLTGQANDLLSAFMYARTEATKRDVRVSVCARMANPTGTNVCNNGQQWDNGWLVVIDVDGDGEMDAGTKPLKSVDALTGSNTLKNGGSGPKGSIVFTSAGYNASGASTFTLCDPRGQGREITVSAIGRATIATIPQGGCK